MRIFELPCAFVSVIEQQKFCCVNVSARAPRVCAFHNYISEPERQPLGVLRERRPFLTLLWSFPEMLLEFPLLHSLLQCEKQSSRSKRKCPGKSSWVLQRGWW